MYDIETVENFATMLGFTLRAWQAEMILFMLNNPKTIEQGARQAAGKTWSIALVATIFLADGKGVVIGMPNQRSSKSILAVEILENLDKLRRYREFNSALFPVINNTSFRRYVNGARFIVLTANNVSIKEGYGDIDLVIIDEGHRLPYSIMAIFNPFLALAAKRGEGHFIITGIGGPKKSLIVEARETEDAGFKRLTVPASYISTFTDEWDSYFEENRRTLGPLYAANFECADVTEGEHFAFASIPTVTLQGSRQYAWGIDPGGTGEGSDFTVVLVGETDGVRHNICDILKMRNQRALTEGQAIYDFIDKYPRRLNTVGMERNGLGYKFYDMFQELHIRDVVSVYIGGSDTKLMRRKVNLARYAEYLIREGLLGTSIESVRTELESVTLGVDDKGRTHYSHSDIFSALLVYLAVIQQNGGLSTNLSDE
jgi:hypothetical protein